MNNEHSEKLLNAMGKNVSMAMQSLEIILPDIDDEEFKEYIVKLNDEYSIIFKEIKMIAKANDVELKLINPMEKAELWTAIKMKTVFNKTTRKYATMIFLGTNMGIPDLVIAICDFSEANAEIIELAKKLKELEEKSDETLKLFLCK
jgi:RNA processing factor Prp31